MRDGADRQRRLTSANRRADEIGADMAQSLPSEQLRCDIRFGGPGVVSLAPFGELDDASVGELQRALREVRARELNVLIVDLRGLEFMGSAGLHVLVDTYAWARRVGVELMIVQGSRAIRRTFEVSRLDRVMPLVDGNGDHS